MIATVCIVAIVAFGGGASFAAESAVPGDILYGVKTTMNENVRGALALGEQANADWHVQLAERRLKEAEQLSARGSLTSDVAADLAARFGANADVALKTAADLASKGDKDGADEIAAELSTALREHSNAFGSIQVGTPGDGNAKLLGVLNGFSARVNTE